MNIFALILISSWIIYAYSHTNSTKEVTLCYPVKTEENRGPTGVPGKRGIKGETGSRGE